MRVVTAVFLACAVLVRPAMAGEATPGSSVTREARLAEALRRFDEAVAVRDHDSPEARSLYDESLRGFESVIHDGVENGHLYYNAGNAALRLGRIGLAIAYYRRAEAYIPGDADLTRNLAFARSLCGMQVAARPSRAILDTLLFWHRDTATRTRGIVAVIAYAGFWTLLFLRLLRQRKSTALFWTTAIAALIAVSAGASVAHDVSGIDTHSEGVIAKADTVLRKGNGEGYQPQLERPLAEGVEFEVLEVRDSAGGDRWLRVRLRDGTDGWIHAERAILI